MNEGMTESEGQWQPMQEETPLTMTVEASGDDEPLPRLMITKMVLENFKSYAGVKEIGPFHKCFSAVVGPNGSGKSNVIDAMLFVFGKRAKKLRLNKVSELIHKSDAVKNDPPQYARVSVHFHEIIDTGDGDEDYRIVPNTETVVTRVAKKDNSSTYKLNGKNSSFKEIAGYLSSKGIDLDNNRFLILQGEVEMISMMPPKGKTESDEGLLEYLEDIIGSSKFVEATNQAAEKVDTLTEVRQEKLNRVKAMEKEKDSLEGAKQEAESLLTKEREIRRKQNILFQVNAMQVEKELALLFDSKENVAEKLNSERAAIIASSKRIEDIESGLVEQRKDYEIAFEELKRTKDEFSAFERKDIKLREEIKHERLQKKKLDDKINAETKKVEKAASKHHAALARIPMLEKDIIALSQCKIEEEAKLELIEEETKVLTQQVRVQLEAKTKELAPVKQERAVLQAALETAETEKNILEDSTYRAKERLRTAENELASMDGAKHGKLAQLAEREQELQKTEEQILALEKEDAQLAGGEAALEAKHCDLMNQIEDTRSAIRFSGGKVRSKAVQGIMKAASRGGELSKVGILGRLGDLAAIPEQYDVAISTACGGMLDNIVVHTTAGAQRCLEFLRKYNLGRASFIPLDKQKKGAHDRPVETPENAPRLFDMITPSNFCVTPAIFLAVGNTLVAPDMDTATRWAYDSSKRWRVVTLNGNLIETTGTMSGGGRTARSGGMRIANSKVVSSVPASDNDQETHLGKLEQEAQQAHDILQECRKRRFNIKNEIRSLIKNKKTSGGMIPKLKLEIESFETSREELTKLIPELRLHCVVSSDEKEKTVQLAIKVNKCRAQMAKSAVLAERLESELLKLQQDILDAGGARLKNQRDTCNKLSTELNEFETQLNASKVDIASAQKAQSKAKAAKIDFETKLFACEELLQQKEAEFKALESGALEVMTAYEQVKALEAEKRTALDAASKEVDELKNCQAEIRCREIDLLGHLDAIVKQVSDYTKKKQHWEKELSQLWIADDELEDENGYNTCQQDSDDGDVSMQEENIPSQPNSMATLSFSVLENYNTEAIKEAIGTLQAERNMLAKNANMGAIAEYKKKEADYLSRVAELDQVTEERNGAQKEHEELRRQRLEMFMDGFGIITLKLKEMYQMITLGGDAELELVDSLDPFSEGIVFSVRPPKKSWKNISNLSGGEKTLSSLSLVFALHHYKPTPLYVMDEIDAALDFKNVSIVANYIKERTKNAQFVIISLRNNMFELADRLVGIYKTNNCTKSVTINPSAFGLAAHQNRAFADKSNAPANRKTKVPHHSEYSGTDILSRVG